MATSSEMSRQTEMIDEIISRRHQMAQVIENHIDELEQLSLKLADCEGVITRNKPELLSAFKAVDCESLTEKIHCCFKKLNRLRIHFSRDIITMQVVGLPGSGKERFVKTITGINDRMIPVFTSGEHNAKVTTYFRNASEYNLRIYSYTRDEMLAIFNGLLEDLLVNCHKPTQRISTLDEIDHFDYRCLGLSDEDINYRYFPIKQYVDNFGIIKDVIDFTESDGILDEESGRKYLEIRDFDEAQNILSRHNGLIPMHHLAVKYARVFCPFMNEKTAKIEFVDMVQINDSRKAFQILKDFRANNDVCLFVFSQSIGCFSCGSYIRTLVESSSDTYYDESCSKDLNFLIVNKTRGLNTLRCVNCLPDLWRRYKRQECQVLATNCDDRYDVFNNVFTPVLYKMMNNIENIDRRRLCEVMDCIHAVSLDYKEFINRLKSALDKVSKDDL